MFWIIITLILILAVVLIVVVLLQPSKGGGLGNAFGGIGTTLGSTFGSRRTLDFLAKSTTYIAIAIAVLCLAANLFFIPKGSVNTLAPVTTGAPVQSAPAPQLPLDGGQQSAPATQDGSNAAPAQQAPAEGK